MVTSFRGVSVTRHLRLRYRALKYRLARPAHRTSFFAMLESRHRYWRALVARHGIDRELFPEFSKLSGRLVGDAAGVPSPRLLDGPISVANLRFEEYGADFVIKPNWGASSRGVLVLHREPDSVFVNLFDGARMNPDEVRARLIDDIHRSGRGSVNDLVVEESMAVGGVLAQEWKAFTFYGEVGLIQQNVRSDGEILSKFYSADWKEAGNVWKQRKAVSSLPLPLAPEKILEAAKAVSLHVPTGFIRVDLFETVDGDVILGELCLTPGGDRYYRGGLDRTLGRMWEEANVRLLSDGKTLIP